MNQEEKRIVLDALRQSYIEFMTKVIKLTGAPLQKQQAMYRFDEGHMWMQNAIASAPDTPQAPQQEVEAEHPNVADHIEAA